MQAQRFTMRVIGSVLLLALLGLVAIGCGTKKSDNAATASASPKSGGALTVVADAEPPGLDPHVDWYTASWTLEYQIFESPYGIEQKPGSSTQTLVPVIAQDMPQISADGLSLTFQVRPGVKFQPPVSREVTAADIKYSIERSASVPRSAGSWYLSPIVGADDFVAGKAKHISGVKTDGKYGVSIEFTKPSLGFPYVLAYQFTAIVPKEWVSKWGNKEFGRHPLGTGPYTFDSWDQGKQITLKKNENYRSDVFVDTYNVKYSLSPSTQVMMVKSGDADITFDNVPVADLAAVQVDPQWKNQLVTSAIGYTQVFLYLNIKMKPLNNADVRQAIAWAIDREKLCKLQGGAALPKDQQYARGMTPYQADAPYLVGYDPNKSKELLAQAGFANGFDTTLYVYAEEPWPSLFESIQNDLAAVGIKAKLTTMAKNAMLNYRMQPGKTPMGSFTWANTWPDPFDWFAYYVTSAGIYEGGWNCAFYDSAKVNAKLAEAEAELDLAKRTALYEEVQALVMADTPYVPLYEPVFSQLTSPRVGGFYQNTMTTYVFKDYWVR